MYLIYSFLCTREDKHSFSGDKESAVVGEEEWHAGNGYIQYGVMFFWQKQSWTLEVL